MDNMYLGHLSRPQLVNLLLRIVDLLAQPLPQPGQPLPPVQAMQAPPILEPYDASIDPWNEPEQSQPATAASPDVRRPRPMCGTAYPAGLLNPGATAFYPMVPGANCPQGAGGVPTNTNVPNNSMYHCAIPEGQLASPGQVGEVHQLRPCGCKSELCDTLCVLQRRGHTTHRCMLHKIP